jgi:hypothetical protein
MVSVCTTCFHIPKALHFARGVYLCVSYESQTTTISIYSINRLMEIQRVCCKLQEESLNITYMNFSQTGTNYYYLLTYSWS